MLLDHVLAAMHANTSLPWYACLSLCTLAFRTSMAPLAYAQLRTVRSLSAGPRPAIAAHLSTLLRTELAKAPGDAKARSRAYLLYGKGMFALLKGHKAGLVLPLVVNLAGLSFYITSVREAMSASETWVLTGGPGFASDLAQADPTFVLPISAVALTYLTLDLGQNRPPKGGMDRFRQGMQTVTLFSFPFVTAMPVGYFCYWIPSSMFSIAQNLVMRRMAAGAGAGSETKPKLPRQ
jgi:YidC/Oxa1 family membrane protein insertase